MTFFRKKKLSRSSLLVFLTTLLFLGSIPSRVTAQTAESPSPTPSNTPAESSAPPTPSLTPAATQPSPTASLTPFATQPSQTASLTPAATQPAKQTPTPTETDLPAEDIGGDYLPNEILVRFLPSAGDAQTATEACFANDQANPALSIESIGATLLQLNGISVSEAIARAKACPQIRFAEPNYRLYAADTFPNDPYWGNQYGLIAIHAPQGWDLDTGSAAVTIAVLDTGVDLTHPDLAGKIVAGYDFVNNDALPQDDNGHGTHVAGIAAAAGNNGAGIAGVSWGARIMPVKVLNASANGSFANVAAGVVWATDHGANIINLSLGGSSDSVIFHDAIDYAYAHGVMLIAASGNSGNNFVLYPARYANVMAVGATDSNNALAPFSNYGAEIDVVAPGVDIFSAWLGGNYQNDSGTSMSAPFVSGLAAILRGIPGSGSPANLAWAIKSTALDLGLAGRDDYYGDGLIQMDAAIALLWVTETPTPPTPTFTPLPSPTQTRPAAGYTPSVFLPTATMSAAASPFASATETAFITPTALFVSASPAASAAPELFALSTPMPLPPTQPSPSGASLLPLCGSLLILLSFFLFYLGKKWQKESRRNP